MKCIVFILLFSIGCASAMTKKNSMRIGANAEKNIKREPGSHQEDLDPSYCSTRALKWGFELSFIPGNPMLGTKDFCAFTYEAKAWKKFANGNIHVDQKEIHSNGCHGVDAECNGGSKNWGLDSHIPASVSQGRPWRGISRDNAIVKCQQLNKYLSIPEDSKMKFDLIANSQWQTIALNIASDNRNWTGNKVGSGCLNQGNNGEESGCSYNGGNPERGAKEEARHFLSGSEDSIFHISGNVWELIKDDSKSPQGKTQFMSDYAASADPNIYYAPPAPNKDSSCDPEHCGYGYGWLGKHGALIRGGDSNHTYSSGVFAVNNIIPHHTPGPRIGFRCVLSSWGDSNHNPVDYE